MRQSRAIDVSTGLFVLLALAMFGVFTLQVPAALQARLEAAAKRNPRLEVQLRADRTLPYGRVAELIGLVQKAGLSRVGFVTEPRSVQGDATKP